MLWEPFVVPRVAAGFHDPPDGPLHSPTPWEDYEALRVAGAGDGFQGDGEEVAGPVDELAGVRGVGPDLGDLRLGEAYSRVPPTSGRLLRRWASSIA